MSVEWDCVTTRDVSVRVHLLDVRESLPCMDSTNPQR